MKKNSNDSKLPRTQTNTNNPTTTVPIVAASPPIALSPIAEFTSKVSTLGGEGTDEFVPLVNEYHVPVETAPEDMGVV